MAAVFPRPAWTVRPFLMLVSVVLLFVAVSAGTALSIGGGGSAPNPEGDFGFDTIHRKAASA